MNHYDWPIKNHHFISAGPLGGHCFLGKFTGPNSVAGYGSSKTLCTSSCTAEDRDAPNLGKAVHVCPQVCGVISNKYEGMTCMSWPVLGGSDTHQLSTQVYTHLPIPFSKFNE